MILILSFDELDLPTDMVCNWLFSWKIPYKRVNGVDFLKERHAIYIENTKWSSSIIDLSKIKAVWIRRWIRYEYFDKSFQQNSSLDTNIQVNDKSSILRNSIINHIKKEFKAFSGYVFNLLTDIPKLGHAFYSSSDPDKALQLRTAQEVGLKIPSTLLTTSKQEVARFAKSYRNIICKNISDIANIFINDELYVTYTSLIDKDAIAKLPEEFSISLFQEAIEKEFEIRTFYLDGNLYSMAIFSAGDSMTNVDFRNYNINKPNRTVPFIVPVDIEKKIINFMDKLSLKTGSLDLIYSKTGEFIFLEVNTVGQFGMVSIPCNYNLDKIVSQYLVNLIDNGE